MAKQIFVTTGPAASGIRIEFQSLPASEDHPAGYAWGALSLWLGDTRVWSEEVDGIEVPVNWTWVSFLEGIGRVWPWLTLEEAYPIPIQPEHPGKLDYELARRWDGMVESQRNDEKDLMFDFNHRHNLALLVRGVNLPRIMVMREGNEIVLWSPMRELPVRVRLSEFLKVFSEFGDYLSELLQNSSVELAILARKRWQERQKKSIEYKAAYTFGIEDLQVISLLNDVAATSANDDIYADSEIRAAARMTSKKFAARDQIAILSAIGRVAPRSTPDLDEITANVPNADSFGFRGFEQGYQLAIWFREHLNLGFGYVDPERILQSWCVDIIELEVDPEICAVAVWGRRHGPCVIVNTKRPSRSSGEKGRRATLAHEICHLIYDRHRSLPVADVMGGLGPQFAEKRANAFAAEFLLPRSSAAQEVKNAHDEILKVAKRLERKYGVSREIVRHQILNSGAASYLNSQQTIELTAWARQQPGFSVIDF